MGNPASRLGCLGRSRSRSHTSPKSHASLTTRGDPSPSQAPQGPLPPGIPWAWWISHAVQVTEVTETVVTETVVTEAVEASEVSTPFLQAPLAPLDTLCSWLDGMEELQASQGPLTADATLAASQFREQELLLLLLRERASHMESRLQEAGSPVELYTQWHHLVQQAETRKGRADSSSIFAPRWRLLEQLVPAARSFESACKALLVKLSLSERLLHELQLGPECPGKSLPYFQEMCEGIMARAKGLERVLETGQRLAELLTKDQAHLVRQQLCQFQERVRLTESQVACAQQKLLCAQRTVRSKTSPSAGLGAQLELKRAASAHPEFKDQKQLSVQLAQLAERLEQLAQGVETSNHATAPTVTIWNQNPSPAVLQADMKPLEGLWLETQEQDTGLKVIWEPAVQILCGLTKQAAIEKLSPEDAWNPALQEYLWGQQTLVVSCLRRRRDTVYGSTCHLGLLMDLLGCQAAVSSPSCERIHTLEGMLLFVDHLVEKLVLCSLRLNQAEPLGIKVVQAQSWGPEEVPGALSLTCWTQAPREVLTVTSLDQGPPRELRSRTKACLLGRISGEQSWRPCWTDVTVENWSQRKPEHCKKNQEKRDQWVQMEQGHQEQVRADSFLAAEEKDRDGQGWSGYTWGRCGPEHKHPTMLEPGLPSGQKQPHNMIRTRNMEGTSPAVARSRSRVQGAWAARGALMVRVGGGWAALDEFLVKNDPVRAKGRTSQKIHERFLCWTPSVSAADVITLRLWTSLRIGSHRRLSQKSVPNLALAPPTALNGEGTWVTIRRKEGPRRFKCLWRGARVWREPRRDRGCLARPWNSRQFELRVEGQETPELLWIGETEVLARLLCRQGVCVGVSSGSNRICGMLFDPVGGVLLVLLARSEVNDEKSYDRGNWADNQEAPGCPDWVKKVFANPRRSYQLSRASSHRDGPLGGIRPLGRNRKGPGLCPYPHLVIMPGLHRVVDLCLLGKSNPVQQQQWTLVPIFVTAWSESPPFSVVTGHVRCPRDADI
ncbi:Growth-arrest-specific 2 domain containing [Sigmodon hispidus]